MTNQTVSFSPPASQESYMPWPEWMRRALKPRRPRPDDAGKAADRPPPLGVAAGLEPNTEPLDLRRAAHLLRRTSFGAVPALLPELVGLTGAEAADRIVDAALARPLPEPPPWADAFPPPWDAPQAVFDRYVEDNGTWTREYRTDWFTRMHADGLRERLALFWHNHFVTEWETYFFAPMVYRYVTLLRTHALGNFREFVRAVGVNPAMLIYLNGELSTAEAPNENYARELLELFTMGPFDRQGRTNYTQEDIVNLSLALTGWWVRYEDFSPHLDRSRFAKVDKTIFGRTGNFEYNDVIDLIFEERARPIAEFISAKLYEAFVYATPDEAVVAALADVCEAHDFALAPVVRALLRSAHFFDDGVLGAQLKSPVELLVGLMIETDVQTFSDHAFTDLNWTTYELQQDVLQPPNVAGWPGYRTWISTSTLPARWEKVEYYLYWGLQEGYLSLVPLAERLHDPDDPLAAFVLPAALAEHFLAVPAETLGYEAPTAGFTGDLVNHPIPDAVLNGPAHVRDLALIFLNGTPWYEWRLHRPGAPWLLFTYLLTLIRLPEYQLM